MKRRMDMGDGFLAAMLVGLVLFAAVILLSHVEPESKLDPASVQPAKISVEEARFMLECTQDWGLTGDECRAVLHGENPPVYDGETGC